MHEFGVSLRLGKILFMASRLNKVFGKGFEVWNQNWKILGCGWIIGFRNIFGVSKVSQPPEFEFSIIKIEFPMYVVEALASIPHSWEKRLALKSLP